MLNELSNATTKKFKNAKKKRKYSQIDVTSTNSLEMNRIVVLRIYKQQISTEKSTKIVAKWNGTHKLNGMENTFNLTD